MATTSPALLRCRHPKRHGGRAVDQRLRGRERRPSRPMRRKSWQASARARGNPRGPRLDQHARTLRRSGQRSRRHPKTLCSSKLLNLHRRPLSGGPGQESGARTPNVAAHRPHCSLRASAGSGAYPGPPGDQRPAVRARMQARSSPAVMGPKSGASSQTTKVQSWTTRAGGQVLSLGERS